MARVEGSDWIVEINTAGATPVWTVIKCQVDSGLSLTSESVDTSSKCEPDWSTKQPIALDASISMSGQYDSDNTGWEKMYDTWEGKTTIKFRIGALNAEYFIGTFMIDSLDINSGSKGVIEWTAAISQTAGDLARA